MEKEIAYRMYELFRNERYKSFELHRNTLQNYLAFSVTILGATIVGVLEIRNVGWIGAAIVLGPILNVLVCTLAIRMCNRFYLGALEKISIITKLESLLELKGQVNLTSANQKRAPVFPGDKYFLPERWVEGTQHKTSAEFIEENMNAGVNRLAKRTFQLLIAVNMLLCIVILLNVFL